MKYEQLRRLSEEANARIPFSHPCRSGNGRCCNGEIPITPTDADIILYAIRDGKISWEIIGKAKENVADPKRTACPFLGDDSRCMIYEYRPLICVVTGTFGLPFDDEEINKAVLMQTLTRTNVGIPYSKCESSMCDPCHQTLVRRGENASLSSVLLAREIGFFEATQQHSSTRILVESLTIEED